MSKVTGWSAADWKFRLPECRTLWMEVVTPSGMQRRLLVELLASELDGDGTVRLDDPGRELAFEGLLGSGMVSHAEGWVALTEAGRELAGCIADHMLGARQRPQNTA
ncbi:MAG: hypothetical protein KUG77_22565 [Nannocystaceae bacterium]|nr:hypothetical protein [Nannocystaceae bacterium]